jgi:hypothetical protein
MPIYSKELWICATAYIAAATPEEAMEKFRALHDETLELAENRDADLPITGQMYDDPDFPEVSLSPAMSIYADSEHAGDDLPSYVDEGESLSDDEDEENDDGD